MGRETDYEDESKENSDDGGGGYMSSVDFAGQCVLVVAL